MKNLKKYILFIAAIFLIGCSEDAKEDILPEDPGTEDPKLDPVEPEEDATRTGANGTILFRLLPRR